LVVVAFGGRRRNRGTRGCGGDQTVRETLREHLQQCVDLAASEQKSGSKPETVRLAERITQHHTEIPQ
jgi:hypothetical protein